MNTKKLLIALVALFSSMSMFSQYSQEAPQKLGAYKTTFKQNAFKDNWEVSFAGGLQVLSATDDSKAQMKDRITFAPSFALTKYFSPMWGLRFRVTGGSLKGYNDGLSGTYSKWNSGSNSYQGNGYAGTPGYPEKTGALFHTWDPQWNSLGFTLNNPDIRKRIDIAHHSDGSEIAYYWAGADVDGSDKNVNLYQQDYTYISTGVDFMVDALTLFGSYDPRRAFELSPFAGIGYFHVFENQGRRSYDALGVNLGLQAKFRVSDKVKLFIEGNGSILPDNFDGELGGSTTADGIGQVLGGITIALGKNTWSVMEPANFELIDDLNKQINDLKAAQKPCPTCPPCPPSTVVERVRDNNNEPQQVRFLPDPVFFRIDKSIIDAAEWTKIEKAADYLIKNPNANVVVTGYADKKTANPAYNMKLSERRSKTVAKTLIEKYGINPLRVSINWEGDRIQPFNINEWNRVVIFVLE